VKFNGSYKVVKGGKFMKLLENLLGRLPGDSTKGSESYIIGCKSVEEDITRTKISQKGQLATCTNMMII
jgi:hypothetical protein